MRNIIRRHARSNVRKSVKAKTSLRSFLAVLAATAVVGVVGISPEPAGAVGAGQWSLFSDIYGPAGIVKGPDGAMWFTSAGDWISRMASDGSVSSFHDARIYKPSQIVNGPDGAMWFVNNGVTSVGSIGRVTTSGALSFVTSNVYRPYSITRGPGGLLWFTTQTSIVTLDPSTLTTHAYTANAPRSITAGPDGAVWFTGGTGAGYIGRITVTGGVASVHTYVGAGINVATGIVSGPVGSNELWFVNRGDNKIGRISTAGVAASYSAGNGGNVPLVADGIALGPDSQIWYTIGASIGRMNRTTHTAALFAASVPGRPLCSFPASITVGASSTLWYACSGDVLGHMSATSHDPLTHVGLRSPSSFATGPDGNTWYVNGAGSIGRITPLGVIKNYFDSRILSPTTIIRRNNELWFADFGGNALGRITTSGVVTLWTDNVKILHPFGLALGRDGNLWYTAQNLIGRFNPSNATVTTFPYAGNGRQIVASPTDSALWFGNVNGSASSMVRVATNGAFSAPITDATISSPYGITVGPDHASVWFTNMNSTIGTINTTTRAYTPKTNSNVKSPRAIALGPDAAVWFDGNTIASSVYRMTSAGSVSTFVCCPGKSYEMGRGMTRGSDGAMWTGYGAFAGIARVTTTVTPKAASFSPTSGAPGTVVTITGLNLTPTTAVAFNGTPAAFTVVDDKTVRATVPAAATKGHITVKTPSGTAITKGSFTVS